MNSSSTKVSSRNCVLGSSCVCARLCVTCACLCVTCACLSIFDLISALPHSVRGGTSPPHLRLRYMQTGKNPFQDVCFTGWLPVRDSTMREVLKQQQQQPLAVCALSFTPDTPKQSMTSVRDSQSISKPTNSQTVRVVRQLHSLLAWHWSSSWPTSDNKAFRLPQHLPTSSDSVGEACI